MHYPLTICQPVRQQRVVDWRAGELTLVSGALDHRPGGADPLGEVVADGVEPGVVPSGHDELGERRRRELLERKVGVPPRSAAADHGHEGQRSGEEVRGIRQDRCRPPSESR